MKALNKFIIIKKHKIEPKKIGGLLMTEKIDEDNRYIKGTVVSVGNLVDCIKENDIVYYDKHAGHGLSLKDTLYHVIKDIDVVIVE